MAEVSSHWFSRAGRVFPVDIVGIVGIAALTSLLVFRQEFRIPWLEVVLGLPFVLFVPGYAFVAALFPGDAEATTRDADAGADGRRAWPLAGGIGGLERVVFSIGLSIAIVPLVGLLLSFTRFGLRLEPMTASLDAIVVVAALVAIGRRNRLPRDERYGVSVHAWYTRGGSAFLDPDTRGDVVLNLILAASVLLAGASVAYAYDGGDEDAQFTELYLLTEAEDGDLVPTNYPTEFDSGESKPIVVGVENHEAEAVEYTVVIVQQRVQQTDDGGESMVLRKTELDRFSVEVAEGERIMREVSLQPTMTGERIRVVFLLYRGDVPSNPTFTNAYRESHLFVNVSAENSSVATANAVASSENASASIEPAPESAVNVPVAMEDERRRL